MRITSTSSVAAASAADLVSPAPETRVNTAEMSEASLLVTQRRELMPAAHQETNKGEKAADSEKIEDVVNAMNEAVRIFNRTLKFEVNKEKRVVIRVIDTSTGEVVRQIPPDTLMDAFHRMDEALGGILIDRRV